MPVTIEYLIVAGGGGGSGAPANGWNGAGGGAGGMLTGTTQVTDSGSYAVTVGGGGGAGTPASYGGNGGNSAIAGIGTAVGGGGGAHGTNAGTALNGAGGGSGGGGTAAGSGGSGTVGQGNNGAGGSPGSPYYGGGGGGAGSAASTLTGGSGVLSSITGVSYLYSTGGSSYGWDGVARTGPNGVNYGDGGWGGSNSASVAVNGGAGAQGIVVIRYLSQGVQEGSGGTITHVGNYTIHTFTGSGTFIAPIQILGNMFLVL